MRRHIRLLTAVVFTVSAVAGAGGPALAGDARSARAEHDRIVAYWTPARMRAAIPRDFVRDAQGQLKPVRGKPGGGGGGDGGQTVVKGASWTKGGPVVNRTGKVYFVMGGTAYICSGTIAADGRTGFSLVLTAAHCAFDETTGDFAESWMFIPAFDTKPTYDCASTQHGCWTAQALVVHEGYADAGGFNQQAIVHDFAFAVVGTGGKDGTTQLDSLGSYDVVTSGPSVGTWVTSFGYPAAGKFKGNDLVYCAGPTSTDPWMNDLTWSIACEMTGGSSGGGWLSPFDNTSGSLRSLNSYGYSGVKNMYGPKFNADTQAVYDAADEATGNTIVQ